MRAGARALSLLSNPLTVSSLRVLEEAGPQSPIELRAAVGSPPQTTMRAHLRSLVAAEVLERDQEGLSGTAGYRTTCAGRELLELAESLEAWLDAAPCGGFALGAASGKSLLRALGEAWSLGMVRALAALPLSLTELNKLIVNLNYPSLERRLAALRLAGLVEAQKTSGRGTPYAPSEWMRRAVGPLTRAIAWERRHAADAAAPPAKIDVEAAFLLAVPLISVPSETNGRCRFVAEVPGPNGRRLAGVTIEMREGRVAACTARLEGEAEAGATGSATAWLAAAVEGDPGGLETRGDRGFACSLLDALHQQLAADALVGAA